ncbi:hypothetical protein [Nocardioides sp.]|uniref:Fenitrothion hydrolase n=1 Tax=metagenome TaxID=256318 RepID=A0A2P2BX94_9ZZZZ
MNLAHGLGGGSDLPIPAAYAIAGGGAALTLSFVILLLAWRTPRFDKSDAGLEMPGWFTQAVDSQALAVTLRAVGLLFAGFLVWVSIAGKDLLTNPAFGLVYVWLWVGLIPVSLLFGPVLKAMSPVRTLHLLLARATGEDPDSGLAKMPARLGYWPAAVGLFAFVWLELVYPDATYLSSLRLWFAGYVAAMLIGALYYGSSWLARADPFEVYSTLVAHLSVWGRRSDGVLVLRNPLANLDRVRAGPGLVAVVAILLGSTAFDSFRSSNAWLRWTQTTTASVPVIDTVLLAGMCLFVGLAFVTATMATGVDGKFRRAELPAMFAHSLVPIIVGYMVAHYLTFFVETGQATLILVSDPLSNGSNLFGTANWEVNYWLSEHPTLLASIKVLAIVTGHILGAVAAHDRALQVLPKRHQATGQLPLLAVMVLYTFSGLYLLFGV